MGGDFTSNLLADIDRLRAYSVALQQVMRGATFDAPDAEQASDSTRAATVSVDADGMPKQIRIAADWTKRLDSADLGGAISDAHHAALQHRLELWEKQLKDSGWLRDVAEFQSESDDGRLPSIPAADIEPPTPTDLLRPVSAIADDVIAALDVATSAPAAPPLEADRPIDVSVARGRIEISYTRSGGLAARIDNHWAQTQSAAMLMTYLDQAVDMLRLRVSRSAEQATPAFDGSLDSLLAEAMAHLSAVV